MNLPPRIDYIDMPESLRDKYQYYTQAGEGVIGPGSYESLEDGVRLYVQNFLSKADPYL